MAKEISWQLLLTLNRTGAEIIFNPQDEAPGHFKMSENITQITKNNQVNLKKIKLKQKQSINTSWKN